jgi:hypothetical protein
MKVGLREFKAAIRLFRDAAAANYVALQSPSGLAASYNVTFPSALPGSTQAMTLDSTGQIILSAPGGGGSVTSVAVSTPSFLSVSGSPVTTSGTIALSLASQVANSVFAAPDGATGAPTFRSLLANDIPSLTVSKISNFATSVTAFRLDQFAAPTTAVAFGSQRITGLADPIGAQDAATKAYVDATAQGLDVKASVQYGTLSNIASIATANAATIQAALDPVGAAAPTLVTLDRVLVKNQTTLAENGIYAYNGTNLVRATDADTGAKLNSGAFTFIEKGDTLADSGWTLITDGAVTIGTTPLTFSQFSGAGAITAGNGLSKTGNTLSVLGTANRITVSGAGVDIASNYTGQATITTLGTITTGVWNATTIAVANGGTGATTAAAARSNLAAAGVFTQAFTSANISAGVLTVTHNLNRQYPTYIIADNTNQEIVPDNVTFGGVNGLTVDLTTFGTITGTWNITCTG